MFVWFFSTMVDKTSCEKNIHEGNETWGQKCKIKHFSHTLSKNCTGKWFFLSKSAKFSKFFLLCIILFEKAFEGKKIRNEWTWYIYPFVNMLFFRHLFITKLTSFSNFLKNFIWYVSTCFFKHVIPLVL